MIIKKEHPVPKKVDIDLSYIRFVMRGELATPKEFGTKMDLSLDENGMARPERLSNEVYNESDSLF